MAGRKLGPRNRGPPQPGRILCGVAARRGAVGPRVGRDALAARRRLARRLIQ